MLSARLATRQVKVNPIVYSNRDNQQVVINEFSLREF